MARHGKEPLIFQAAGEGWKFEEIGRDQGSAMLSAGIFPTNTILCSNDRLAIGFLSACYEKGVKVGRGADASLRVASHDDHPFSRFTCPSLTTAAHDYAAVSEEVVAVLFRLIESGGDLGGRSEQLFAARLVMRESA